MKRDWKIFVCNFWILFYRILYFRRYYITWGVIGNRVEISKSDDWKRQNHKFRVVQPLRTVRF